MRLTMSFTTGNDEPTWFNRLPIIGSRTTSMSFRKADIPSDSSNEKISEGPFAGGLLSRASTKGRDENGRISNEVPRRRYDGTGRPMGGIGLLAPQSPPPAASRPTADPDQIETYREGRNLIFEDRQGDVIAQTKTPPPPSNGHQIGPLDTRAIADKLRHPIRRNTDESDMDTPEAMTKHKPAMAFRFDDNIIVEDEDGEVIKRYKIPKARRKTTEDVETGNASSSGGKSSIFKNWFGLGNKDNLEDDNDLGMITDEEGDSKLGGKRIRLRDAKGRKLSKQQFIHELKMMDPHARRAMVSQSSFFPEEEAGVGSSKKEKTNTGKPDQDVSGLALVDSKERVIPYNVGTDPIKAAETQATLETAIALAREDQESSAERRRREAALGISGEETSAERRRREAALGIADEDSEDSDDDGAPRIVGQPKQRKTREIRFAAQESGQRRRDTPGPDSERNSGSSSDTSEVGGTDTPGGGTGSNTPGRLIQFAEDTKGKEKQW